MRTTAIFSEADRLSSHRYKADESYLVGEGKEPVAAYLDYESIIEVQKRTATPFTQGTAC